MERIRDVACRLNLPATAQVHPVFQVSQLKPFTANYTPVFSDLPPPDLLSCDKLPSAILQRCMLHVGNATTPQGLIKCGDLPD